MEDFILDHNTLAGNTGAMPAIFHLFDARIEGVQVTNNILSVDALSHGLNIEPTGAWPTCGGSGVEAADCMFTPAYVWEHNLMVPSVQRDMGASAGDVRSWWSGLKNYVPRAGWENTGWANYAHATGPNDFRLTANYCSGCPSAASDDREMGANIDGLISAQGLVGQVGVPETSISANSAKVVFVAPDNAGCPVDISASDRTVITHFTRTSDPGGSNRHRSIDLQGLSSHTTYHGRVNCAVEQPLFEFQTK